MLEIEDNALKIAKYLFDNKYFGGRMIVVAELKEQLEISAEDFNVAEDYLFAMGCLDGTSGGDQGYRSLKPAGLQFVRTALVERGATLINPERPEQERTQTLDVFISHSSVDTTVATALIRLLRSALNIQPEAIRCTSVDGYRLPVGASTDEQLRREVRESKAFIGLVTQASLQSAYVLFELGARWGAGLHLAPVLASGADGSVLRGPLNGLNALNCSVPAQLHQLIDDIGKIINRKKSSVAAYQKELDELVELSNKGSDNSSSIGQRLDSESHPLAQPDRMAERLEVLGRNLEFKTKRQSFQNSPAGTDLALSEVEQIIQFVGQQAEKANATSNRLKIDVHLKDSNQIILFCRGISLSIAWDGYVSGTVKDSTLRIALWHGVIARTRVRIRGASATIIDEVDYSADLRADSTLCWTDGNSTFDSRQLAESWFGRMLDQIEKP